MPNIIIKNNSYNSMLLKFEREKSAPGDAKEVWGNVLTAPARMLLGREIKQIDNQFVVKEKLSLITKIFVAAIALILSPIIMPLTFVGMKLHEKSKTYQAALDAFQNPHGSVKEITKKEVTKKKEETEDIAFMRSFLKAFDHEEVQKKLIKKQLSENDITQCLDGIKRAFSKKIDTMPCDLLQNLIELSRVLRCYYVLEAKMDKVREIGTAFLSACSGVNFSHLSPKVVTFALSFLILSVKKDDPNDWVVLEKAANTLTESYVKRSIEEVIKTDLNVLTSIVALCKTIIYIKDEQKQKSLVRAIATSLDAAQKSLLISALKIGMEGEKVLQMFVDELSDQSNQSKGFTW